MARTNDTLLPVPSMTKIPVQDTTDKVWRRISYFASLSQKRISQEMNDWQRGASMYADCYDTADNEKYNPTLLADVVQRAIDQVKLADYVVRVPDSSPTERQLVKDAITQTEQASGLYAEISDDDKGALSWVLLGNLALWWGKSDDNSIKEGCPITFKSVRLSQAYIDSTVTSIRESNGKALAKEAMVVCEYPYGEVLKMFPVGKPSLKDGTTGKTFNYGKLPIGSADQQFQAVVDRDADTERLLTEVGYYYNIQEMVYEVRVGNNATIVERHEGDEYPFYLDGEPYLPVSLLKCFPVIGELYAKGFYHRYAKLARNDARRRSMAHKYMEGNVNPDKFVKMDDSRYATFINDLDISRQIRANGDDSYLYLRPDENVQFGDFRGQPLTQEFERMKNDDREAVLQGGIALQDVGYSPTQPATTTLATEKNKTRLTDHIIKINAGESTFMRRVIVQFIRDHIGDKNDALLATNAKIELKELDDYALENVKKLEELQASDEDIQGYMMKNAKKTGQEKELDAVTMGQVADYIRKKDVYIQSDFSAWNEVDYNMRLYEMALRWAGGTPMMATIQKTALSELGFDAFQQDVQPIQPDSSQLPQQNGSTIGRRLAETAGGSQLPNVQARQQ